MARTLGLAPLLLPAAQVLLLGLLVLATEPQLDLLGPPQTTTDTLQDYSKSDHHRVTTESNIHRGSSDTSLTVVQKYVYYVEDLQVVKCHCGADEILSPSGACQYFSGGTSLDTEEGEVPTAWATTTVRDLQCPHQHAALNFSRGEIHIRQRGDLVVQTGVMKGLRVAHYCLSHHLDSEGSGQLTWTARTCIKPPSVPRCCPPGQIMLEGGCVHAPSNAPKRWAPPLSAGPLEAPISWPVILENLTHPVCTNDPLIELSLQFPNHMVALPKGVLLIWESSQGQTVYTVQDYCIDGHLTADGATSYSAYLCYSDPLHVHEKVCKGTTCIRKCCPQGEAFSEYFFRCVPTDQPFLPIFLEEPEDYTLVTGGPLCDALDTRVEVEDYVLSIMGHMEVLGVTALPPTDYCVDSFISGNGTVSHKAHVCLKLGSSPAGTWVVVQAQLLPVLLGISCLFLCLLVACFVLVPELRVAEGSYQLSHVTSLLASFTAYFLLQVFSVLYYVHYMACMILALLVHFGFLATFFWLSILCADLWRRVRHLKSFSLGAACTPLVYHLLGWGGPAAIISISIGLHFMIPNPETGDLNSGFAEDRCWFAGTTELLVYFYSPIAVLMLISIILVALSCWKSRIMGQENISLGGREGSSESSENDATGTSQLQPGLDFSDEVRYYICLVSVSAFWWITEGLAIQIGPPELWSLAEIINSLHGLIVTIIFFLNPNKRHLLLQRLTCCTTVQPSTTVTLPPQSNTSENTTDHDRKNF